jgi:hypothetical protein
MLNKQRQSYAPFGSLSTKISKKKKNQQIISEPGPGTY